MVDRPTNRPGAAERAALANVPTSPAGGRLGDLTLPGTKFTGNELSTVLVALRHRQAKADLPAMLATATSSGLAIFKSLGARAVDGSWSLHWGDVACLLLAAAATGVAIDRYARALKGKDPLNDEAQRLVLDQMNVQGLHE